jgi:hypothetical protein
VVCQRRSDGGQLPPLVDEDPLEALVVGIELVVLVFVEAELFVVLAFAVDDLVELSELGVLVLGLVDPAEDEVDEEAVVAVAAPALIASVRIPPPTSAPVPAAAVAHLTRRRARSRSWIAVDLLVMFVGPLSRLPLTRP